MYSSQSLYFDDLAIGQEWESAERIVTDADIVSFADLTGDRAPIHLDEEFARKSPFQQRIAHGLLGISLACGLAIEAPPTRIQAFIGLKEWQFCAPIFINDSIRVRSRVADKKLRGRGKRGTVDWTVEVVNQNNQIVQRGSISSVVECMALKPKDILSFVPKAESTAPLAKAG